MPKFSESSKQRLKGELAGKVREPFAVITSIEQKRGAKLAEHGVALSDDEALKLCAAVKADTGEDIPPDLMRKLCALMDEPPGETPRATPIPPALLGTAHGNPGHLEPMAEGEFCIFTAEPEGDVDLPDGGTRKAWTETRLQKVVENHGPAGRIAQTRPDLELQNPVVIGHEEDAGFMKRTDTPAAGWLGPKLRMAGTRLMASFRDMPDKVKGWVKDKVFPTRSAEFYPDYHGFGPALRRVALLGGQIPAKKDLGDTVFFGENEPAFEVVTFREAEMATQKFQEEEKTRPMNPELAGRLQRAVAEQSRGEGDEDTDKPTRAELIMRIASASKIEESTVNQIIDGDIENPPPERIMAIARVLGLSAEDLEGLTPEEGEEEEKRETMSEPTKPKPDGNGEILPEAFAEMTKRFGVLQEQFELQKNTVAQLREENTQTRLELDTAQRERQKADVDAFCEQLNRRGQATGATLAKIKDFLLKSEGVEKFAEGASAATAARALFGEILPRVESDGRTLMTADALNESDPIAQARAQHADYVKKTGSDLTFEQFAEGNQIELPAPEEKTETK